MTAGTAETHQRRYSIGLVAQLVHTHRWKHSCETTIVPIPVIAHFRELRIALTCTSAIRAPTARPTRVLRMCARALAEDWSTAGTIISPIEDTSETAATNRRPRDIDAIVTTFIRSISIHTRGKSVCGDSPNLTQIHFSGNSGRSATLRPVGAPSRCIAPAKSRV